MELRNIHNIYMNKDYFSACLFEQKLVALVDHVAMEME